MTIEARVAEARETLRRAGIPEADLDARVLAEFVLDWDDAEFLSRRDETAGAEFLAAYDRLVARRSGREPLAYITGRKAFWHQTLEVSPAVLIPRPETELIVEAALARCPDHEVPLSIADVGTGSGCLAVALAVERPRSTVVATDLSAEALDVARRNAVRYDVDGRIRFVQTDLLRHVETPFDLVVSNPPYVPESERAALQPEVRDHEPSIALFAGDGGLSFIRRLVGEATARLKSGGFLVFECGFGQSAAVHELLAGHGALRDIELLHDLQGIPRTAIARKIAS